MDRARSQRRWRAIGTIVAGIGAANGFMVVPTGNIRRQTVLSVFAPPGSGYSRPEDEESVLPKTYKPMMAYPGTMRPGTTPENQPFQDLPIGDKDPDPVPWPHFQQIEWHHKWDPPHEHAIPMEDFIELNGRWATPEMEAAMRAGVRRDVRERREKEEAAQQGSIITDDDDDTDEPVSLGDGIFGKLGSDADRAQTAAAVSPDRVDDEDEEDEAYDDEGDLDDFLLDLGLDAELDEDISDDSESTKTSRPSASLSDLDADDDDDIGIKESSVTTSISVEDDDDLGLDDDEDDMSDEVPLEDDLGSDTLDGEDIFGEGGFDFDDFDGGGDIEVDDW